MQQELAPQLAAAFQAAKPVLFAVGALFVPLLAGLALGVTLLHSAYVTSVAECAWVWFRFLKFRAWDSAGAVLTRTDKAANLVNTFHAPLLMAVITLRMLVMRAMAKHVPHTSARKRNVVLGLGAAYAAGVWLAFSGVAAQCSEAVAAAAAETQPGTEASMTPFSLFLHLYHATLWATLLTLVSTVWVPTSDARLREAEHALLRAHQASSGSSAASLDQQLRQHHAGHIAYTVLQHEEDAPDVGSGKPDENEDGGKSSSSSSPSPPMPKPTAVANGVEFTGPCLVFLHGFGAGKSFFMLNLPAISRALGPSARVYSLDCPGMGSSAHQYTLSRCHTAAQAEEYFVAGLESWRKTLGLKKVILVAHSFGGLIAACYALKYPQHVEQLLLVSPVGLPVPPPLDEPLSPDSFSGAPPPPSPKPVSAARAFLRSASLSFSSMLSPKTSSSSSVTSRSNAPGLSRAPTFSPTGSSSDSASSASESKKKKKKDGPPAWLKRTGLLQLSRWLWAQHVTPSQVLHWLGPFGPLLFRLVIERRFAALDAAAPRRRADGTVSPAGLSVRHMSNYLYHLNSGPCPGHRGLNLLLRPGAFAVDPLLPRLVAHLCVPCSLLYGENDWMSQAAGQEVVDSLRVRLGFASAEVVVVPSAGHQVALENPRHFNASIVRMVREQRDRADKRANAMPEGDEEEEEEEETHAAPIVSAAAGAAVASAAVDEQQSTEDEQPGADAQELRQRKGNQQ
jgi:cardiolipin-specific phospholipase